MGPEDLRDWLTLESLSMHVGQDAHDGVPWTIRWRIRFTEVLADGVFLSPHAAGHRLIDDGRPWPAPSKGTFEGQSGPHHFPDAIFPDTRSKSARMARHWSIGS